MKEGGGGFRARFGVERDGVNLLAEDSYPKGSDIKAGYPEFTMAVLKKLGWDKDLTAEEMAIIQKIGGDNIDEVNWKTDLSGGIQRVAMKHGCAPFGNAKARAVAWNLPTRSRSIASRSTRRAATSSRSIRRSTTGAIPPAELDKSLQVDQDVVEATSR